MAITAAEQYAIELLNRARLDPAGEARRHGMGLNDDLASGRHISNTAKQVLAPNALLDKAATQHGQWMIDTDTFSHYRGVEGSKYYLPGDRMAVAGYNFAGASGWSENIDLFSITSSIEATIRDHHARWLGSTSGHREAMFGENSREIGYAHVTGNYEGYNVSVGVQNYAYSGSRTFVTGVAYTDRDKDDFYSIGEGRAGLSMKIIGGDGANTQSAGGYALQAKWGQEVTVAIEGGTRVKVDLDHGNVKLDVVNNSLLKVSGDVTLLTGPIKNVEALGVGAVNLTGNDMRNRLTGSDGRNVLTGAGGSDTLSGGNGNDILRGGDGADALAGNGGADHLNGNSGADRLTGGTGADTFQFATGSGADVVTDFTVGQGDRLGLAKSLWGGGLTDQQVVSRYAEVLGGNVLFDFGDGDTLLLQGVRSLNGLADRIDFL